MDDLNFIYNAKNNNNAYRHHRILRIVNDVMISILSSIANRHNISGQLDFEKNVNLSDIESCKIFIVDHVSLLEAIRLYKLEKNAKYQQKAKMTLQRIFYKYARIYLIARKGYKDQQHSQRDLLKRSSDIADDSDIQESVEFLNQLNFTTSDASRHSVESVAILVLEIFGTFLALSIGLWSHLELIDWTILPLPL